MSAALEVVNLVKRFGGLVATDDLSFRVAPGESVGLIQEMRQAGMTFLIVSHDLKALEPLIDRAIAVDRGKMIAEGSYADVIGSEAVRASYLGDA